jgi:hypothetical protein
MMSSSVVARSEFLSRDSSVVESRVAIVGLLVRLMVVRRSAVLLAPSRAASSDQFNCVIARSK